MALTQKGLIDSIGTIETRQYNDKTYVSRSLVIEQPSYDPYTGEKRNSNYIKFEATRQETCDALNNFSVGNKVEVEFIVRGSKYDKKDGSGKDVFTRLELRAIALASTTATAQPAGASPIPAARPVPAPAPVAASPEPAPTTEAPAGDYDPDLGF